MKRFEVAIIGAGTAGLSARREVAKKTDNYVVIDDGPLGTTCARVGCMPSKVLIQVANDFYRRKHFAQEGIIGAQSLSVDSQKVMSHVRSLRDRFVRAVEGGMSDWTQTHLIQKRARFVDHNTLDLGDEQIFAKRIIIATGSSPVIPGPWQSVRHRLIDTNAFFELPDLPKRVVVIGLGVIGLELGQALSRLGIEVNTVTLDKAYGGLSDPELQAYAHKAFSGEFPVHLKAVTQLSEGPGGLQVHLDDGSVLEADKALISVGRRPNLAGLGMEEVGVKTNRGMPDFNEGTFKVIGTPWFLVGDVNQTRPILHEAADQGRIAGYNALSDETQCFQKRTALSITFSAPNIARIGESHRELTERNADFVIGQVSYEGQGRAIVKLKECGQLHIYADRKTGAILGSELIAPEGEHLAHLIAWAMAAGLSVRDVLSLPFYHPVIEEGLRTALRDAQEKIEGTQGLLEVLRCADPPVGISA